MSLKIFSEKRGDTLVEVMFAIAVFAFVVILTISMMNQGVATAEESLELVTTRNEMSAQVEALRFIHSSYISEKTLPRRGTTSEKAYQQYAELWEKITANAVDPTVAERSGLLDLADTVNNWNPVGVSGCNRVYDAVGNSNGRSPLSMVNAFVLNVRDLSSLSQDSMGRWRLDVDVSYIGINGAPSDTFIPAPLNARIIYGNGLGQDSAGEYLDTANGAIFNRVASVEGLWVFAVTDGNHDSKYYDFYIETCWYGLRSESATALDTVIRLYNPENV